MKLVIPSAGLGSRVSTLSNSQNKALLSIGELPVIVRVIDQIINKFPITEIIILTGYKSYLIETILPRFFTKIFYLNLFMLTNLAAMEVVLDIL